MEPIAGALILKPGRDKPVRNRHPWVFSGAILRTEGQPQPGDLVTILDSGSEPLGTATYNPASQIVARIISWDAQEPIDDEFWRSRLDRAIDGRTLLALPPATTGYRLVYAESDGLPGLIVDGYNDVLAVQLLTLGMERRKEILFDLLQELLSPAAIVERSDVDVREKEGLESVSGVVRGTLPDEMTIQENGFHFPVDVLGGHKTGFYLDQRDNRALLNDPALVSGHTVLNLFSYTGAFGVYAAAGGAAKVLQVDSSVPALEAAEQTMALNGFDSPDHEYMAGDAFEVLRYFREEKEQFDVIVLDPPKFAHSQSGVDRATRGYKDLNWLALRLLRPGGVLLTFSCSGLISADLFQKVVFGAAVDAGRDVQIMRHLSQAADHPVLLTFPESAYLKGLLCRVW